MPRSLLIRSLPLSVLTLPVRVMHDLPGLHFLPMQ